MFIFLAVMCTESLEAGTLLLVIIEIHLVGVVSSKSSAVLVFIHLNTAIKSKGTHKFSGVYKVQSEGRKNVRMPISVTPFQEEFSPQVGECVMQTQNE